METSKSIYEYENYRVFLKDLYETMKSKNEQHSYRWFAKKFSARAPNFLKRVIDGQRNLSLISIDAFCKSMDMTPREAFFFKNLTLFNQATNIDQKKLYAEQLVRANGFRKFNPLGRAEAHFYTKWYYIPILEMAGSPHFSEIPEWIAARLRPRITPEEASTALQELISLKLLIRSADGRLRSSQTNIETKDDSEAAGAVLQYHRDMIRMAGESLDRFKMDWRDISTITFNLTTEKVPKVKELLQRFRTELGAVVGNEANPAVVYQLNLQFFPVAMITDEKLEKTLKSLKGLPLEINDPPTRP